MKKILLLLVVLSGAAVAQVTPPGLIFVVSDPAGACTAPQPMQYNYLDGTFWGCDNGTWAQPGGGGGGTTVNVNGSSVSSPNFNGTTPAAQSGKQNVTWQVSGSSVSGEVPTPAFLGVLDAIGSGGAAQTISLANGAVQTITLSTNLTVGFTQPATTGRVYLIVTQGASVWTVTWTSVKWPGGIPPVMSAANGAVDIFSCLLDGTNTWCTAAQNFQ